MNKKWSEEKATLKAVLTIMKDLQPKSKFVTKAEVE